MSARPPSPAAPTQRLHATAVSLGGKAILLIGTSGSGKSDLALRLIEHGAKLIGDDYVEVIRRGKQLHVKALKPMQGHIEVRGVGIVKLSPIRRVTAAPLRGVFELVASDRIERLPEPATYAILGLEVPLWKLAPFEQSALRKLKLLLGGGAR